MREAIYRTQFRYIIDSTTPATPSVDSPLAQKKPDDEIVTLDK